MLGGRPGGQTRRGARQASRQEDLVWRLRRRPGSPEKGFARRSSRSPPGNEPQGDRAFLSPCESRQNNARGSQGTLPREQTQKGFQECNGCEEGQDMAIS